MKGDFTRRTFDPEKHFAAVLMQQGRVQLDADWNEFMEMFNHRWRVQTTDTIGRCGAPVHNPGFVVGATPEGKLTITPGRIYVDGILCELETALADHMNQPHPPDPEDLGLDALLGAGATRTDLVYLKASRRHVSALEDPTLREPALEGADTTTRLQTVWQVHVLQDVGPEAHCEGEIPGWEDLIRPSGGRLTANAVDVPNPEDPCLVEPLRGYSGLENRLYRVEIHEPDKDGRSATFKVSRDNASIGAEIEEFIEGAVDQVRVRRLGRDSASRLRRGHWVEVLGDTSELNEGRGTLARITDIIGERTLLLDRSVASHRDEGHPRVRRWDMKEGPLEVKTGPIELERGIQVSFMGEGFIPGDYWLFAARTSGGMIEELLRSPPHGIEYAYCRLALVTWTREGDGSLSSRVEPCAPTFPPLSELPEGGGCCVQVATGPELGRRIQEGLDELPEEGGCICLPTGVHLLERPLTLRERKRVVLCGCGGVSRLVYLPDAENPAPAIAIERCCWVTLRELGLFSAGAPALVSVEASQGVEIQDSWLINLPKSTRPAPCVVVGDDVTGLLLRRCNLVGDAGIFGMSGPVSGTSEVEIPPPIDFPRFWPRPRTRPTRGERRGTPFTAGRPPFPWRRRIVRSERRQGTGAGDVVLDRCKVRAQSAGIYLRGARSPWVLGCEIAGLSAERWERLHADAERLGTGIIPTLEEQLCHILFGVRNPGALVPVGVAAFLATDLRVIGSGISAGLAVLGLAAEGARIADNRILGVIGLAMLNGSRVDIGYNSIATALYGVVGSGLCEDWQVRANRILSRRGISLAPGSLGEELALRALRALAKGLGEYAAGTDAAALRDIPLPPIAREAGAPLSQAVAADFESVSERFCSLGAVGRAAGVIVKGNVIASDEWGMSVEMGVESGDICVAENRVLGCRVAGIRLHGTTTSGELLDREYGSSHKVEGNQLRVSGLGISVESDGAAVIGNEVQVAGRIQRKPDPGVVSDAFSAANTAPYARRGAERGDIRLLRDAFSELSLRLRRHDLSGAEEEAVVTHLDGPFADELRDAGFIEELSELRAGTDAVRAGDRRLAARHLGAVRDLFVGAVGSVGIRLAAHDTVALANTVHATGTARGGISVDSPTGGPADHSDALANVAIRENRVYGGTGHGVEVRLEVQGLEVVSNSIRGTEGNGITTSGPAGGMENAEVSHNTIIDFHKAPATQFVDLDAAGILLAGGQEVRMSENTVRMTGCEEPETVLGIAARNCTDISVRANTVRENGVGIRLGPCRGFVQLAGNRVLDNRSRSLEAHGLPLDDQTAESERSHLLVTGNVFEGLEVGEDFLVNLAGWGAATFSHNQVGYKSEKNHYAVRLEAGWAAILGNIWDERGGTHPLSLSAQRYALVGNVSFTHAFGKKDEIEQASDYNVPQPLDIPVFFFSPWFPYGAWAGGALGGLGP